MQALEATEAAKEKDLRSENENEDLRARLAQVPYWYRIGGGWVGYPAIPPFLSLQPGFYFDGGWVGIKAGASCVL